MKDIKLILCDLDGTLLTDNKTVSENTIQTIQAVRDQGVLFGLATGRSLYAVDSLMDEWHIRDQCDVLMGFNGAQIIDGKLGISEINHMLKGESFLEIIDHLKDLPVNFCVYDGMTLYAHHLDDLSAGVAKSNHFEEKQIENLEEFFTRDFPKLVVVCEAKDMDLVIERSKTFSSPNYHCFKTGATLFEYVDPRVSKSAGIARICELHGFTMDEVCVFGDAQNDHDMLIHCGLGVCMANGTEETKAISDDITDLSNNEDGVADYIKKHFL